MDDDTLGRVRQFSRDLVNAAESLGFDRHIILLDLNHQNREKYVIMIMHLIIFHCKRTCCSCGKKII